MKADTNIGTYHSSFAKVSKLLEITFTPDDYISLMTKYALASKTLWPDMEINTYWTKLPRHIFARCPYCNAEYISSVDTHGLFGWFTSLQSGAIAANEALFVKKYQMGNCAHYSGIQTFINLNGNLPVELSSLHNDCGDIPLISPELLTCDTVVAVMHSLPVCRIENNLFIPRYSVYSITYFAEEPEQARKQALARKFPNFKPDLEGYSPAYLYDDSSRIKYEPLVGELQEWIRQGKLFWLDLDVSTLPLTSLSIAKFPYANITGFGTGWLYWKPPKPRWWRQARNWHPNGEIRTGYQGVKLI